MTAVDLDRAAPSRATSWLAAPLAVAPTWLGLALAVELATHGFLLVRARPLASREWAFLAAIAVAQCVLVVASLALLAAHAPMFRRALLGFAAALPALFWADALVAERTGEHLPALAKVLFDVALGDRSRVLDASGIDRRVLVAYVALVGTVAWGGARLEPVLARRDSGRRPVSQGTCVAALSIALLGSAGLERSAAWVVRSDAWARVGRELPQLLGGLGPATRALATFRAALRPRPSPAAEDDAVARASVPSTPPPGDIFFFVLESLRADAIDPALTPAIAREAAAGLSAEVAVAGGNITQYGWFTLFTTLPAFHWRLDPAEDRAHAGAVPLRLARRRGWRIEALVSHDLGYMHMDDTLFGPGHALADDVTNFLRTEGTAATKDDRLMQELGARVARPHPPTLFIVSLDGTHFPYSWGEGFAPPRAPYAGIHSYLWEVPTAADPDERRAVMNRYLDAVAFEDSLVARLVDQLRAAGTYDDATLVLVGDHGEEHWEHGFSAHGGEPCALQTHVPLVVRPSRALRAGRAWPSTVRLAGAADLWPTLLDAAGVRGDFTCVLQGSSLLEGAALPALAGTQRTAAGPARFVVDDGDGKVELALSEPDAPRTTQTVNVLALRDAADRPTDEGATPSAYEAKVRARFGAALERAFVVAW